MKHREDNADDNQLPLVSVIIPVYNGERYLGAAIESVLAQTYRPLEVIVVDDGSTDGSAAVARGFGEAVRCYSQENAGQAAAQNAGVEAARGDYFAFLDADDLWAENKLELQMKAFADDLELDIVSVHVQEFVSPDVDAQRAEKFIVHEEPSPWFSPSSVVVKRTSFFRVGFFETKWTVGEFMSWVLRANELGLRKKMLPEVGVWRRIHESNKGIRLRGQNSQRLHILKASLDRRRKQQRSEV